MINTRGSSRDSDKTSIRPVKVVNARSPVDLEQIEKAGESLQPIKGVMRRGAMIAKEQLRRRKAIRDMDGSKSSNE